MIKIIDAIENVLGKNSSIAQSFALREEEDVRAIKAVIAPSLDCIEQEIKMFSWRITKYNPYKRDINGIYTVKDEWTSYSDIGTLREGKVFTYEDYKKVEDAYIASILMIMKCNALQKLKIVGLEKRGQWISDSYMSADIKEIYDKARNGMYCFKDTVEIIVRLALREKLWCKLEARSMAVHFGYDYYMYIMSAQMCEKETEKIQAMGLYVERCESPYYL